MNALIIYGISTVQKGQSAYLKGSFITLPTHVKGK
jgi:hypothetical protein